MSAIQFIPNGHRVASASSKLPPRISISSPEGAHVEDLRLSLASLADADSTLPWVSGFLVHNGAKLMRDQAVEDPQSMITNLLGLWISSNRLNRSAEIATHPLNDPGNATFRAELEAHRKELASLSWLGDPELGEMKSSHNIWRAKAASSAENKIQSLECALIAKIKNHAGLFGISEQQIETRLKGTRYQFIDYVQAAMEMRLGKYEANLERVTGVLGAGQEGEEAILHELIHRISGRALVQIQGEFRHFKLGVAFFSVKSGQKNIGSYRLGWLNEAITQSIFDKISDTNTEVYAEQRELLEILSKGQKVKIPMELFYKAFFEDFDSTVGRHAMPAWGRLTHAIGQSFSAGFLNRLDRLIASEGINTGLKRWEECL